MQAGPLFLLLQVNCYWGTLNFYSSPAEISELADSTCLMIIDAIYSNNNRCWPFTAGVETADLDPQKRNRPFQVNAKGT